MGIGKVWTDGDGERVAVLQVVHSGQMEESVSARGELLRCSVVGRRRNVLDSEASRRSS